MWNSVDAFRGGAAVSTWIYRVALNTALAWNRKERKHEWGRQDFESVASLLTAPTGRNPRLDWIYQKISELDEVNRSLALLMLDGFSYREMAEILGLSESNVGVKINRTHGGSDDTPQDAARRQGTVPRIATRRRWGTSRSR